MQETMEHSFKKNVRRQTCAFCWRWNTWKQDIAGKRKIKLAQAGNLQQDQKEDIAVYMQIHVCVCVCVCVLRTKNKHCVDKKRFIAL